MTRTACGFAHQSRFAVTPDGSHPLLITLRIFERCASPDLFGGFFFFPGLSVFVERKPDR